MSQRELQEYEEYDTHGIAGSPWRQPGESTEAYEGESQFALQAEDYTGESPFLTADHEENRSVDEVSDLSRHLEETEVKRGQRLPDDDLPAALLGMPAHLALHELLNVPGTHQLTLASLLGRGARRSIEVAGTEVLIPAYLRMVSRLSGEVAEEQEQAQLKTPELPRPNDCANSASMDVISGYPEYGKQLSPGQKALVTRLAQKVVDSFGTTTPIRLMRVVGHADTALRVPPDQRAPLEREVSEKRAQAAESDLRGEIERLGKERKPEPIRQIRFLPLAGFGATKKFVSHPINEEQMRINRRVEIYFTECTLPVHWTWVDTASRGLAIMPPSSSARKRVRCMLSLLLRLRDKAIDGYLDYQVWKNLFYPPGFTQQQKDELLRKAVTHLEERLGHRHIFGPASEVSDADFIAALESYDEVITRSMRDFRLNAEAAGVGASAIVVQGWKLIQANRLKESSIYSCYASYSW